VVQCSAADRTAAEAGSSPPPKSKAPPLPRRAKGKETKPSRRNTSPHIEVTEEETDFDPEIVLIRRSPGTLDLDDDRDTSPRISVVPVDSADQNMIRALNQVADSRGAPVVCATCRKIFAPDAPFCPYCGTSHVNPLPKRS
jgi:hypothetical protein